MRIVLFASPGILGAYMLATLLHLKESVVQLVMPRGQYAVPSTELTDMARGAGVPVMAPADLHASGVIATLKACAADLIIVATFDKKIPQEIIELPRIAAINIHSSYLPAYRGACPEFWAMRNGETSTGVTIHYLKEIFDAGDIICQERVPMGASDTLGMLLYALAPAGARLLMDVIETLKRGAALMRTKQDPLKATLAPLVTTEDMRIDWHSPCRRVYDLVRAGNPLNGAWTVFRGFQMKIWHAAIDSGHRPGTERVPAPGTITLDRQAHRVMIWAADGPLTLNVVQVALYYIVDGWEFVQRTGVREGERVE